MKLLFNLRQRHHDYEGCYQLTHAHLKTQTDSAGGSLFHPTWLEEARLRGELFGEIRWTCSVGSCSRPLLTYDTWLGQRRLSGGERGTFLHWEPDLSCDPAGGTNTFFSVCLPDWDSFSSPGDSLTLTSHPDANLCPALTLTWHQPIPLRLGLHPKMFLGGKVKASHNVLTAKECPTSVCCFKACSALHDCRFLKNECTHLKCTKYLFSFHFGWV